MKPIFKLLVLRCANIIKIKDFYVKLGLNFVEEQHGNSPIHYSCDIDGFIIELYPASDKFPVDTCRLGFSSTNIIKVLELMDTGIVQNVENTFFVVVDPDGRKVELRN